MQIYAPFEYPDPIYFKTRALIGMERSTDKNYWPRPDLYSVKAKVCSADKVCFRCGSANVCLAQTVTGIRKANILRRLVLSRRQRAKISSLPFCLKAYAVVTLLPKYINSRSIPLTSAAFSERLALSSILKLF
ncbi:hypothetical protein OCA8868_01302 [Octadecabacter ascidiaceicola]|uniref:Uncharacterized protein n=1 Tax=Octadecabacter ascidiaceicola TaxID=1655543 RepID=A0A238K3Y3_9RHOB|nr:hypothetical protein OCA8868_01302 [Octadecabacter ascidiaceicola]